MAGIAEKFAIVAINSFSPKLPVKRVLRPAISNTL
jgi:hypothetical protein